MWIYSQSNRPLPESHLATACGYFKLVLGSGITWRWKIWLCLDWTTGNLPSHISWLHGLVCPHPSGCISFSLVNTVTFLVRSHALSVGSKSTHFPAPCASRSPNRWAELLKQSAFSVYKHVCYIARLSLNKMSTVIGWFLVTYPWPNSNVSWLGYNYAVVARTPSLFVCFCYTTV